MTTDGTQILEVLPPSPDDLLRELTLQRTINQQLTEQLDSATRRISTMEHPLQQLLHRLYGRSSERIDPAQMALFAQMLKQLDTQNPPPEVAKAETQAGSTSGGGGGGGGYVLPKSPMGEAITYALNQWNALCVYTTDGDPAIDNNAAEDALRRIAATPLSRLPELLPGRWNLSVA